MDPLRVAVRAAFAFVFTVAVIRLSGKRTVKQGDATSFVVALIIGDMFDDLFWAEVPAAQFVVGVGTLVVAHMVNTIAAASSRGRRWRAGAAR
jgi:uncharacterized membrane protein YcaP (DUF421 family)